MNKLGAHICYPRGWEGALRNGDATPTVVKAFGDPGVLDIARLRDRVGLDCLIVVRFDIGNKQPLGPVHGHAFYVRFRERMIATANAAGPVAFEMYNEVPSEYAAQLAETEAAWLEDMHRSGLRCVLGNWAAGNPQPEHAPFYSWVLSHANDGDLLGMHDYWAYTEDIANPWYVGRWRLPWQAAWIGERIRIVGTEAGRDVIPDRANHGKDIGKPGWKRTANLVEFLSDLRQYTRDVISEPRVIGSVIYQVGSIDNARWGDFEASEPLRYIVREYAANAPEPPPSPVPTPEQRILRCFPGGARISQRYGENPAYYSQYGLHGHNGLDIACPQGTTWHEWHGTEALSLVTGRAVKWRSDGLGLYEYVTADNGDEWVYAHLSEQIADGRVIAGQGLGRVGYTGNCIPEGGPGTHLHLGWRPRGYDRNDGMLGYADPLKWGG